MSNVVYINVGGVWKQADAFYVNVSGTWKTGAEFAANISGAWKGTSGSGGSGGLPTMAVIKGLDIIEFTLPTIGVIDANASVNSQSLDFIEFTLPIVGMDVT